MINVNWFVLCFSVLVFQTLSRTEFESRLPTFAAFVEQHARTYHDGNDEYQLRRGLFEQRVAEYEKHNAKPTRFWTAGVNLLTDRTEEELSDLQGWNGVVASTGNVGLRGSPRQVERHFIALAQLSGPLPQNASWAHLESLQMVRKQECGSCWAHATALAMETNHEIKRGSYRKFSSRELVKCAPNPNHCGGSGGCGGSTAEVAMLYVMQQGLTGNQTVMRCPTEYGQLRNHMSTTTDWASILAPGAHVVPENSPARAFGFVAWERLAQNKAEPLMRALVDWGPVVVTVSMDNLYGYHSGIFNDCPRDSVLAHAVVLIGFGNDDDATGADFWHIRNSWGEEWGESGNIRLLRQDSDDNDCGEDEQPEQGTGCESGPKKVRVCGMCGIIYDSVVPHFSS